MTSASGRRCRIATATTVAAFAGLGLAAGYQLGQLRLRRQLAAERHRATHDPLTGLLDRAGLADAWPRHVATHAAVGLLDLDGFKAVNDQHGHAAGDELLVAIAARLRRAVPEGLVARLGGDEFAVVVTSTDPAAAARRAAAMVAQPVTLSSGTTVTVTTSVGLTWASGHLSTALLQADAAMYRAKGHGHGRVALYDPRRDDRPLTASDPRPAVRLRDRDQVPPAPDRLPQFVRAA